MAAAILLIRENELLYKRMNDEVQSYINDYFADAIKSLGFAKHKHFTRDSKNCKMVPQSITKKYR